MTEEQPEQPTAQIYDADGNEISTELVMSQLADETLRLALMGLGLPVTGPKMQQARRLVATGLTVVEIQTTYGPQARDRTRQTERDVAYALMVQRQDEPHEFVPSEENEFCAYCSGPEDLGVHG